MALNILPQSERRIEKGKLGGWRPNSGRKATTLKEKIRYTVDTKTGCWVWGGSDRSKGYGRVRHEGRYIAAHRGSYIVYRGEIPEGMLVCHSCDNRICINPKHLFLGTYKDNMQDMVRKGRGRDQTGERSSTSKLTEIKVKVIRSAHPLINGNALANIFNVDPSTICDIRKRRSWKHI